ncbi:MAG: NTP transferase domain-containing protein, partial [Steroidobacteraceae bacterium]
MSTAELYGLVLTGGRSSRMRRDKAALEYAGAPQLARAMQLLRPRVSRCFVSIRNDQRHDPQREDYESIVDVLPDLGPIGGIHAALRTHPNKAWLILACDLPFLDAATLEYLIARRSSAHIATAYRSSHDGLPEPLCAIFEPASLPVIEHWLEQGQRCPRTLLAHSDALLLDPISARALDNVNTPEQYTAAATQLAAQLAVGAKRTGAAQPAGGAPPAPSLRLKVRYFALLREQAGRGSEELQTQAHTPLQLYQELRRRHGLSLEPQFLRVAINDEFGDWRASLSEGDTVAFLPPVAG